MLRSAHDSVVVTRLNRRCVHFSVLPLLLTLLSAAAIAGNVPVGYNGATFGMAEADVQARFPDLTRRFEWRAEKGDAVVTSWLLKNQTVGPLSGCNVELRFYRGELFRVAVSYVDPGTVAQKYLEGQYGPTPRNKGTEWRWDTATLMHAPAYHYWIADDLARQNRLQQALAGRADVVAVSMHVLQPPEPAVAVTPDDPHLQFERRVAHVSDHGTFAVAVADVDRDGKPDLIATGASLSVLRGHGDGTFAEAKSFKLGDTLRGLALGDLNGDGILDVAVASAGDDSVWVLLGAADGSFAPGAPYKAGVHPFEVVIGDFNADGKADLAVSNESNRRPEFDTKPGTVSIFFGDGSGKFPAAVNVPAHKTPAGLAAADFNRDGKLDLAVTNAGSGDFSLLLASPEVHFAPPVQIPYGGHASYGITTGDFDGDGHVDVALTETQQSSVQLFRGDGAGHLTSLTAVRAGAGARGLAAGDVNGDGVIDLVTADTAAGTMSILLGTKGGGLALAKQIAVAKQPRTVAIADLNGDGKRDIVVSSLESNEITVLLNTSPKP